MKSALAFITALVFAAPAFAAGMSSLEVSLKAQQTVFTASEGVAFTVVFHNKGAQDLLLNGGAMLGNASEMWSGLEVEVKGDSGPWVPLQLHWRVGTVAGRIEPLPLPLRAGAAYELPITGNDYFVGKSERLPPDRYEIRCVFHERRPGVEASLQLPFAEEGEARSNTLWVEITPDSTADPTDQDDPYSPGMVDVIAILILAGITVALASWTVGRFGGSRLIRFGFGLLSLGIVGLGTHFIESERIHHEWSGGQMALQALGKAADQGDLRRVQGALAVYNQAYADPDQRGAAFAKMHSYLWARRRKPKADN